MRRVVFASLAALLVLLLSRIPVHAISFGGIDLRSHLGEPFLADVPIEKGEQEDATTIFVEVASPADYRNLDLYRDPTVGSIGVQLLSDEQGLHAELSSDVSMQSPYFNLVLKVRQGMATHFKKFPVFLEEGGAAKPATRSAVNPVPLSSAEKQPVPEADQRKVAPISVQPAAATPVVSAVAGEAFDWARSLQYGPIMHGDSLSTIAQRLRKDRRYSVSQVTMALFRKNPTCFDNNNVHLIHVGAYLDVPTAAEVEKLSRNQAWAEVQVQQRRWHAMLSNPVYADLDAAQRNRYTAPADSAKATAAKNRGPGVSGAPLMAKVPAAAVTRLQGVQEQYQQLQQELQATRDHLATLGSQLREGNYSKRLQALEQQQVRVNADMAQLNARDDMSTKFTLLLWLLVGLMLLLLAADIYLFWQLRLLRKRQIALPQNAGANAVSAPAAPPAQPQSRSDAPQWREREKFEDLPRLEVEELLGSAARPSFPKAKPASSPVPQLSDEDTGEMLPFVEPSEEEPDPNVDYLAEVDVFLRYAMDEEAMRQVRMALRQRPDNLQAHLKLLQVLLASGNAAGIADAVANAEQMLSTVDIERFHAALEATNTSVQGSHLAHPTSYAGEDTVRIKLPASPPAGESSTELPLFDAHEAIDGLDFSVPSTVAESKGDPIVDFAPTGGITSNPQAGERGHLRVVNPVDPADALPRKEREQLDIGSDDFELGDPGSGSAHGSKSGGRSV